MSGVIAASDFIAWMRLDDLLADDYGNLRCDGRGCDWTVPAPKTGDEADALHAAHQWSVLVAALRGER